MSRLIIHLNKIYYSDFVLDIRQGVVTLQSGMGELVIDDNWKGLFSLGEEMRGRTLWRS
jgi:hypothetical protein